MKKAINFLLLLALVLSFGQATAQESKPYWAEILAFKKADSAAPPPRKAILFVGSSSFRAWRDVQNAFPQHKIINRGFGGSSLPHVIAYADDIIFPYKPKQIVIYCGENDLAASDTVSAATVAARFQELFTRVLARLPKTPGVFVSMKPSPSRWKLREKMQEGNRLIQKFLATKKRTTYVDVWPAMLNEKGETKTELFTADMLHMNAEGYKIWAALIEPKLKK